MYTVLNYIRPFEGNHKADVAPGENEFDARVLEQFLGHMETLCLTFEELQDCFSKWLHHFTPTHSVWGFQIVDILTHTCYYLVLILTILAGVKWYLVVV